MPHSTFCVVRLFVCCATVLIVVVFRVVQLCLCFACCSSFRVVRLFALRCDTSVYRVVWLLFFVFAWLFVLCSLCCCVFAWLFMDCLAFYLLLLGCCYRV